MLHGVSPTMVPSLSMELEVPYHGTAGTSPSLSLPLATPLTTPIAQCTTPRHGAATHGLITCSSSDCSLTADWADAAAAYSGMKPSRRTAAARTS